MREQLGERQGRGGEELGSYTALKSTLHAFSGPGKGEKRREKNVPKKG